MNANSEAQGNILVCPEERRTIWEYRKTGKLQMFEDQPIRFNFHSPPSFPQNN